MFPSLAYASAWSASIAVLAAPVPGAEVWPFSRAAAVALPWLVLAGVPRAATRSETLPGGDARAGSLTEVVRWTAGALAPLLVGARLDQLDGLEPGVLAGLLAATLAAIAGLAFGAARMQGDARQASLWTLGVLLPPLMAAVLTLLPGEALEGADWSMLACLSPVGWAWSAARAPAQALQGWALAWPLAMTVLVAAGGRTRARAASTGVPR